LINWGASLTEVSSVTLSLNASDPDGVAQMCISNTPESCTAWEDYKTQKAWGLSGADGMNTVYVWFRDAAGNANAMPYSDSITVYFDPGGGGI
jgi:hypothetical protein